jgi:hypothetical protein
MSVGEDARLVQDRDARLASLDPSLARGVADAWRRHRSGEQVKGARSPS